MTTNARLRVKQVKRYLYSGNPANVESEVDEPSFPGFRIYFLNTLVRLVFKIEVCVWNWHISGRVEKLVGKQIGI